MTSELLLDAIGFIDDQYLQEPVRRPSSLRRLSALLAAVLILMVTVGAAMAASPDFRAMVFSIFHISSQETPPLPSDLPTDDVPGLREVQVETIGGEVAVHYFIGEGIIQTLDGGFYTCSAPAAEDAAFWEIRPEGIARIEAARCSFPLAWEGKVFQILFDYALVNDRLQVQVWPQDLDQNPVGNGWNALPLGDRTDVVLLSIPVSTGTDYTHDFLLLELETRKVTDLLSFASREDVILDAGWFTEDLHYGLFMGIDPSSGLSAHWLADFTEGALSTLDTVTGCTAKDPYFLDEETILFRQPVDHDRFHWIRHHLPTGTQTVILTAAASNDSSPGYRNIQKNGAPGKHGLLFREDGSIDLIALSTGKVLNMPGLDTAKLITSESPSGNHILLAYEESNEQGELGFGFSSLGLLDPATGVLKLLTRQVSGSRESFRGWLDDRTVVITAYNDTGGYYVYVYEFSK